MPPHFPVRGCREKSTVCFVLLALLIAVTGVFWHPLWRLFIVVGLLTLLTLHDLLQTQHTLLRNYPIFGHLRYAFEDIHIQNYSLPFLRNRDKVRNPE